MSDIGVWAIVSVTFLWGINRDVNYAVSWRKRYIGWWYMILSVANIMSFILSLSLIMKVINTGEVIGVS